MKKTRTSRAVGKSFFFISLIIFLLLIVRERLFFNDDLDFLYGVVAGFWEWSRHGLGYAIIIYCPAAKVVLAWRLEGGWKTMLA